MSNRAIAPNIPFESFPHRTLISGTIRGAETPPVVGSRPQPWAPRGDAPADPPRQASDRMLAEFAARASAQSALPEYDVTPAPEELIEERPIMPRVGRLEHVPVSLPMNRSGWRLAAGFVLALLLIVGLVWSLL